MGSMFVFAADSASGKPIEHAQVWVKWPDWWALANHASGPSWHAFTDSTGWARLGSIAIGRYDMSVCHNSYERKSLEAHITPGRIDTLQVQLHYIGPPHDGRRCELFFDFSGVHDGE